MQIKRIRVRNFGSKFNYYMSNNAEFVVQLSDYQLFKKDSVARSYLVKNPIPPKTTRQRSYISRLFLWFTFSCPLNYFNLGKSNFLGELLCVTDISQTL